jgi:hypothetical protein
MVETGTLTEVQFRVLSASEGRVDFELDIHKDHTVSIAHTRSRDNILETSVHTFSTLRIA